MVWMAQCPLGTTDGVATVSGGTDSCEERATGILGGKHERLCVLCLEGHTRETHCVFVGNWHNDGGRTPTHIVRMGGARIVGIPQGSETDTARRDAFANDNTKTKKTTKTTKLIGILVEESIRIAIYIWGFEA